MRITGNGVIFTAIAAAGVILLSVAARMSSLAAEIEHMQQDYDQWSKAHPIVTSITAPSESLAAADINIPPTLPSRLRMRKAQQQDEPFKGDEGGVEHQSSAAISEVLNLTDFFIVSTHSVVNDFPLVFNASVSVGSKESTTSLTTSSSSSSSSVTVSSPVVSSKQSQVSGSTLFVETLPLEIRNDSWPFARILYDPQSPCRKQPKAISAVLTLPKERKVREWVREQIRNVTDGQVIPVFPLGRPSPHHRGIHDEGDPDESRLQLERSLLEEAHQWDDVIIADFVDSYEDLSRKSMLVFDWFAKSCQNDVQWLIKEDVDVVINWKYLLEAMNDIEKNGAKQDIKSDKTPINPPKTLHVDKDPIWLGHRWLGMPVIRDPKHRNFEEIDLEEFPPYCSGPCYLMNNITVSEIVEARRKNTRYYRNEDAMLGLLLYDKAVPIHDERFIVFVGSDWRSGACGKRTGSIKDCDCEKWWTYHCGGNRAEREAGLIHSYECANKPLLAADIEQILGTKRWWW